MNVVFPGSFDPITLGHINIIDRIISKYNTCEILVLNNINKKHLLTIDERKQIIEKIYNSNKNITISSYDGLLANYITNNNIDLVIRGVRNIFDFENEKQNAYINKKLCGVETILMFSDNLYEHCSSTVIKDIYFNNGDIQSYVDPYVLEFLNDKFRRKKLWKY